MSTVEEITETISDGINISGKAATKTQEEDIQNKKQDGSDRPNLSTIPQELLVFIFTFLDAQFIQDVMSKVCTKFYYILSEEIYWRIRMRYRWKDNCPISLEDDTDFNWKEACRKREAHHKLWKSPNSNLKKFSFSCFHANSAHAIHFMPGAELCISGSSDRNLIFWNINEMKQVTDPDREDVVSLVISGAHKGWIWSLSSQGCNLYSSGWDGCVRCWDVSACPAPDTLCLVHNSPVLATCIHENTLVAGTWNSRVHVYDVRTSSKLDVKKFHNKGVLGLALSDKYLISSSEDKSIAIFDRVAAKIYDKIKLPDLPLSMSYKYGLLWVGDTNGRVYTIDPKLTNEKILAVNSSYGTGKINSIKYTLGSVVTGSSDHELRILEPTLEAKLINQVDLRIMAEIECVDVNEHNIIAATAAHNAYFWIPNEYN